AGAMAHNSPVARISEAHPGPPRAGPWRVPDAAFGLIRATHLLVSMRSVARARGPTVTTIAFTGGRGGATQPPRPGRPDKRSASGIPAGWAMARPGCGLRPYPGYSSTGVDAVSGAGEGTDRHYHPFTGGEGGGTQPRRPRSPDKRSASGIPAGWAMARPGCGLRPYPGYASADVDAVGGVPSRRGEGRALRPGRSVAGHGPVRAHRVRCRRAGRRGARPAR